MKSAIEIGPLIPMRRASDFSSSVVSLAVMSGRSCAGGEEWPPVGTDDEERTEQQHRHREQHAHGQWAPEKAEMRIRFTEDLAGDAGDAIAKAEPARDEA